jgi:hypothetical protein
MDSPCLSAGGLRFSDHRMPAEELGRPSEDRSAYRHVAGPQRGYRVPHRWRCGGGRRPLYGGVEVSQQAPGEELAFRVPFARRHRPDPLWPRQPSLRPPVITPPHQGFTHVRLSHLPLARLGRDGSTGPWTLSVCSRPSRYRDACADWGPAWTLAGAAATGCCHSIGATLRVARAR